MVRLPFFIYLFEISLDPFISGFIFFILSLHGPEIRQERVAYFLRSEIGEFPGRCFGMNSIFWATVSGTKAIHPGTRCRDVGVYPMGSSDNSIVGSGNLSDYARW